MIGAIQKIMDIHFPVFADYFFVSRWDTGGIKQNGGCYEEN